MAPPKNDAFADLFQSAAGTSRKLTAAPMNDLSLKQPMAKKAVDNANWFDLEALSPGNSSTTSRQMTPQKSGLYSTTGFANASGLTSIDPFSLSSLSDSLPPQPQRPSNASPATQNGSLLDDEFTDAFVEETPKVAPTSSSSVSQIKMGQRTEQTLRQQTIPQRKREFRNDDIIAELVDIGFSIEDANEALLYAGPDLQECVNFIMNKNSKPSQQRSERMDFQRSQQRSPPDFNAAISDVSNKLYSTASWFIDTSKKKVISGISTLQQQHLNNKNSDGTPAWMKNQHKYKDGALERKNGESYEDYGTDEENINTEEIQRIIATQKQRERERQRERLSGRSPNPELRPRLPQKSSYEPPEMLLRPSRLKPSHSSPSPRPAFESTAPSQPSRPTSSQSETTNTTPQNNESVDLLGLTSETNESPAQKFKLAGRGSTMDDSYSIPSRRTQVTSSRPLTPRIATNEVLNAFQQSDYETLKEKGAQAFSRGDFNDALEAYTKCLQAIPEKHELRIVITSNLALTAIKLGDYRLAKERCNEGIVLVGESYGDTQWTINDKSIKYWYIRLLSRKAESLEHMEQFPEALECYMLLISKHGVTDLKIMDAKRRVNKIVNPPKPQVKRQSALPTPAPASKAQSEKVQRIQQQHQKEKQEEQMKFELHDKVHDRMLQWSKGKETNIRALLMSLSDVLPQRLGFPFITNKVITMNDLMLTKKVKINYMKVISSIHPDKLEHLGVEDKMICQLVFVALNKAWDEFKVQNQIA